MNLNLYGRNIILRPLTVEDAAITQKWRMGGRAKLLNPGAQTVAEQAAWIASRPGDEYNFIQQLYTGQPVGMLSLVGVDRRHHRAEAAHFLIGEPELVAQFGPAAIAAESTQLLYQLAFEALRLHRLNGTVAADNHAMLNWNLYIGWEEEGRLRDHYFLDGHYQDAVCVGLLEDAYRAITIPRLRGLTGE